jgi:hypothetical protein
LRIEITWGNRIGFGHNSSEDRIIVFTKTSMDIGDELVILKRGAGGSELVSILTHLSIVTRHREMEFLRVVARAIRILTVRARDCDT